jgi:hypothetical protein
MGDNFRRLIVCQTRVWRQLVSLGSGTVHGRVLMLDEYLKARPPEQRQPSGPWLFIPPRKSSAVLARSTDSRRRRRPSEKVLQFRRRLELGLGQGHHRRQLQKDAAIGVLAHQVSLVGMAR